METHLQKHLGPISVSTLKGAGGEHFKIIWAIYCSSTLKGAGSEGNIKHDSGHASLRSALADYMYESHSIHAEFKLICARVVRQKCVV